MSLISSEGVTSIKRDRVLFEDLQFSLSEGEIVHLKGPNGAGKTSLMRMIAGLSTPTEGEILFRQQTLQASWQEFTHQTLYIGHKSGCSSSLTAVENTVFWSRQQGLVIDESQIEHTLFELGLAGVDDIPVSMLSAGQQRRVALARLWLKPKATLWLLDEPFTALDVNGVAMVENKLQQHCESGGCVLVTSHQPLSIHPKLREWTLEYRF
jgi:heme exporter protein A